MADGNSQNVLKLKSGSEVDELGRDEIRDPLKKPLEPGTRPDKGETSPAIAAAAVPADLDDLERKVVAAEGLDDFNWSGSGNVVARSYGSIAVYSNWCGDLVIRQENFSYGGRQDDIVVVVPRAQVSDVILAMQNDHAATGEK